MKRRWALLLAALALLAIDTMSVVVYQPKRGQHVGTAMARPPCASACPPARRATLTTPTTAVPRLPSPSLVPPITVTVSRGGTFTRKGRRTTIIRPGSVPRVTTPTTFVGPAGVQLIAGLDVNPASDRAVIQELGRPPALLNGMFDFEDAQGATVPFPITYVDNVLRLGATPMITWRPFLSDQDYRSPLTDIVNGSLDSYIRSWADAARSVNQVVYVRLMHEMNGNWYPWGAVVGGSTPRRDGIGTYPYTNTPAMYVEAYRHVVGIFKMERADNVRLVWCVSSWASGPPVSQYFPGDAAVDWAAMDGYNRSSSAPQSFEQLFTPTYQQLTAMTAAPIMVAETATVEYSGAVTAPISKAQWITDAFLTDVPQSFPRIRAVCYFDGVGRNGESFPFDSSQSSLGALRQVFATPLYSAAA